MFLSDINNNAPILNNFRLCNTSEEKGWLRQVYKLEVKMPRKASGERMYLSGDYSSNLKEIFFQILIISSLKLRRVTTDARNVLSYTNVLILNKKILKSSGSEN